MIRIFVITLLNLMSYCLIAQSISPSVLKKMEGKWDGQLTYTDYQDDTSQTTLKCMMEAKWNKKKGFITFIFVEPDGRIIKDKTKIKLKKDGTQLVFDAKYRIVDFSQNEIGKSWKLTLGTVGKDNNRDADITSVINLSKTQLTITKLVKYKETDNYFERNRYVFEKDE